MKTELGKENNGQNVNIWGQFWNKLTPESEIKMWDYYGGRKWILKYTPRFGKVIEAGCGLGRYVFYLTKMGIDIEGLDFHRPTIEYLNDWKIKNGYSGKFISGDVKKTNYDDSSISGYISLGVIEHFIEGPHEVLKEAYRILRPGGIAVITTPNKSIYIRIRNLKTQIKTIIKKLIKYNNNRGEFFQYEYTPDQLKQFAIHAGFRVVFSLGLDLLYVLLEIKKFNSETITGNSLWVKLVRKMEQTSLANLGAQSLIIAVKEAPEMYCFLCAEKQARPASLNKYTVPLCEKCLNSGLTKYYEIGVNPRTIGPYIIKPQTDNDTELICAFCNREYVSDKLFEHNGFSIPACPICLKKPEINLLLSNAHIKNIWRDRS